jgi:hypothetical protein
MDPDSNTDAEDRRVQELEQQLAYLQWSKLRNERAIREAIESSKVLKQGDQFLRAVSENSPDKKSWKATVLQDELNKPLKLTDEQLWVIKYERGAVSKGMDPETVEEVFNNKGLDSPSKESILLKKARVTVRREMAATGTVTGGKSPSGKASGTLR